MGKGRNVTRQASTVIVAIEMALGIFAGTVVASPEEAGLTKLISDADAIVAVEILKTDYTATAADGPMYAEAKVLRVIKGPLGINSTLWFGESGWWGPTYSAGERRVLFLQRVTSTDYYSSARWATLHTGGIDFFFSMDFIEALSGTSLKTFLQQVQEVRRAPLKIKVVRQADSALMLSVTLINDGNQAICLNRTKVAASFEVNGIRYSRGVQFMDGEQGAWIRIGPAASITGTVRMTSREVKATNQIMLLVSHRSVSFPNRCWVGTLSTLVPLAD
jgi:hypothetical protein